LPSRRSAGDPSRERSTTARRRLRPTWIRWSCSRGSAGIPLQVGTTNGGNDGSVFGAYGVPDVPLGWPLRYSHSPVEVIDLRDLLQLAELVRAAAEGW